MLLNLQKDLKESANPQKAKVLSRFFKTGKGEYGEGDIFLGLTVSESREIAKKYIDLSYKELDKLLKSKIHEKRLIALLILIYQFGEGANGARKKIFESYLKNTQYINNWDLVDLSAPKIVGEYLRFEARGPAASHPHPTSSHSLRALDGGPPLRVTPRNSSREILIKLAKSKNLWEKRISILATFQFIAKEKDAEWTFKIASILISDKHDLIQKAVGWMLREVGKRISEKTEREFLDLHYKQMGRTALRYSIERFSPALRVKYLRGEI